MKKITPTSKEVVYVREREEPLSSPNTVMIAALYTLGIPLLHEKPFDDQRELVGDEEHRRFVWYLESKGTVCGNPAKAQELIAQWNSREWLAKNPDHPLTYLKYGFENYNRLLDVLKRRIPTVMVRKNGRLALIPLNASPERRAEILSRL